MKFRTYSLTIIVLLGTLVGHAQQVAMKENAIKVAALVPGQGDNACARMSSRPCAVTNKSPDRTITVKVEESFLINNTLIKKQLVLDKVAPNENRYIGCAGCTKDDLSEKCTGYKIVMAYYEQPDSVRVRAIFYDDQTKAVTAR